MTDQVFAVFVYQLCFNFSLALIKAINEPAELAPKKARQRRAYAFLVNLFLCVISHRLYSA